jgi:hypothetical protein
LESEGYLTKNIPKYQRKVLAMLRTGVLPLEIETGRYEKKLLQERFCKLCNTDLNEDEAHFLCNCPLYDDIREPLWSKAEEVIEGFNNLTDKERLQHLLSNIDLCYLTAKCCHKMYKRRQIFIAKK